VTVCRRATTDDQYRVRTLPGGTHSDYRKALAKGRLIASGAIEAPAATSRWSVPGAEAVLLLRAGISNNHFEEYWAQHFAREIERIRAGSRPAHCMTEDLTATELHELHPCGLSCR
jgi:hypothetical protein